MAILIDRNTKLITIGITGKQGSFHSLQSKDYGTNFVGGVTPGKGGTMHEGFPVYNSVSEAVKKTQANTAMICVPAKSAADSIMECIDSELPLVICITEGIPVHDMVRVKEALRGSRTRLIGPNASGIINPGEVKVGIMPSHIHMPGKVGIVSRSGTLSYEVALQLTAAEIGQSTSVGIGGDQLVGSSIVDILELFERDRETKVVVLIGEVGGNMEIEAATYLKKNMSKPVVALIVGHNLPEYRIVGHPGAYIKDKQDSAEYKEKLLKEAGVIVVSSISQIVKGVTDALNSIPKL